MTETKRCPHCGQALPLTAFYLERNRKDGRSSWCRECKNAHDRTRYKENQEQIRERRARQGESVRLRTLERHPQLQDAAWLRQKYLGEFRTTAEIALEIGCAEQTARRALREWGIAAIPKALHAALRAGKQRVQA